MWFSLGIFFFQLKPQTLFLHGSHTKRSRYAHDCSFVNCFSDHLNSVTKKEGEWIFRILEQSIPSRGARSCKDSETVANLLCLRNSLRTKVVEEAEFERESGMQNRDNLELIAWGPARFPEQDAELNGYEQKSETDYLESQVTAKASCNNMRKLQRLSWVPAY